MNASSELAPTRSRATRKPRVDGAGLPFFSIGSALGVLLGSTDGSAARLEEGPMRQAPLVVPPYAAADALVPEGRWEALERLSVSVPPEELGLSYRFVGGLDGNAMEVNWHVGEGVPTLDFVALKTFTGMQLKYPLPGKPPRAVFAFADEDAYCYCDLDPCEECTFRCKSGFVLYAYGRDVGLVGLPCGCAPTALADR